MNHDRDAEKIRELLHELKKEDERLAPTFARHWERALSQTGKARPFRRVFPVAAAVLLIVLGGLLVLFFRPLTNPPSPMRTPAPGTPTTEPPSPPVPLISQWRSPTDFLLKAPGDPLLKTVPRLGESLVEMEALRPDKKK